MARILITSGPTRQYLDPVRYLTNASSGRMGAALALAVLEQGHEATVISGPVEIAYPPGVDVLFVETTEEMLDACESVWPQCNGVIGAAAPCDYRPIKVATHKLSKEGGSLRLHLVETPDIMAALGRDKGPRWMVAFALETTDHRYRALQKLQRKSCDLVVSNGPTAIRAEQTSVEILAPDGTVVASFAGSKRDVARGIIGTISERLL